METRIETSGPEQTAELARLIGERVKAPVLILLKGGLGSGKTVFAKAFARGFGSPDETSSPSFAIANTYQSPRGEIHHLDLYRIGDPEELYYIGLDDYLASGAATLIEWPEIAELEDRADLVVSFSEPEPGRREITFRGDFDMGSIVESFQNKG